MSGRRPKAENGSVIQRVRERVEMARDNAAAVTVSATQALLDRLEGPLEGTQEPRVEAAMQPLITLRSGAVLDSQQNAANACFMITACVVYFVVMTSIFMTRNTDPASLPVSFTLSVSSAQFLNANDVDAGGNGTSPLKFQQPMYAQGVAFTLVAGFLPVCVYALAACANLTDTLGWWLYGFRWIPTYNYNTKLVPCIMVMIMLSMIEIPTQIGTGFRTFDVLFTVITINFALAALQHEQAKYLDTMMRRGEVVKQCVSEATKLHFDIFQDKGPGQRNPVEFPLDDAAKSETYRKFWRAMNPTLDKKEIDITWFTFASSAIVALSLVPMQIRYNAMAVKPQWITTGVTIVWMWKIIFTGIPYMVYMLGVFKVARWGKGAPAQIMSAEQTLRAGHMFAFVVHLIYPLLFTSVFVGIYARSTMSAQNPANVYVIVP